MTISLTIGGAVLWLVIGVSTGVLAATHPRSLIDKGATFFAVFFYSMPTFLLGLILLYFLFFRLHLAGVAIFPGSGYVSIFTSPAGWAQHLLLPWIAVALTTAATYTRLTRAGMLEVLGEDYIRTARAKGVSERRITYRHALRAALTSVVTQLGIDVGVLLGGAVVTENIFGLPGLGQLAVQSVTEQDLPVIIGIVMLAAAFVVRGQLRGRHVLRRAGPAGPRALAEGAAPRAVPDLRLPRAHRRRRRRRCRRLRHRPRPDGPGPAAGLWYGALGGPPARISDLVPDTNLAFAPGRGPLRPGRPGRRRQPADHRRPGRAGRPLDRAPAARLRRAGGLDRGRPGRAGRGRRRRRRVAGLGQAARRGRPATRSWPGPASAGGGCGRVDPVTGSAAPASPPGLAVWEFAPVPGGGAVVVASDDPTEAGWYRSRLVAARRRRRAGAGAAHVAVAAVRAGGEPRRAGRRLRRGLGQRPGPAGRRGLHRAASTTPAPRRPGRWPPTST